MKTRDSLRKYVAALSIALLAVFSAFTQQRLLVIGGGDHPPDAIKKFVGWSGGEKARILVITWATSEPNESFMELSNEFKEYKPAAIEASPVAPIDADERTKFITQLKQATGVYFTGGDQNRIMDVLGDTDLLKMLREKYASGTPFAGSSAGAAVMSDPMMTGEADLKILDGTKVGVRMGLGLIPNVIFDQHFLVRQRHNRLFGLVMVNRNMLGIGIDEDTAVLIQDNRRLQVAGATQVMFVDAKNHKGSLVVSLLKAGEWFDLKNRKRLLSKEPH